MGSSFDPVPSTLTSSGLQQRVKSSGWSLEPGWKLVKRETIHHDPEEISIYQSPHTHINLLEQKPSLAQKFGLLTPMLLNSPLIRRKGSLRGGKPTSTPSILTSNLFGGSATNLNSHFENGIGRVNSNKGHVREIPVTLVPERRRASFSHGTRPGRIVEVTEEVDPLCPVHHHGRGQRHSSEVTSSEESSESSGGGSYTHKPLLRSRSAFVTRPEVIPPEPAAPPLPPGVLKKPGMNRGNKAKSMKKVAFLDNTEFSRGLP